MSIGIDIGAHGAITCADGRPPVRHPVPPAHERVILDLLPRVGDQTPMIFWDDADQMQRIQADQLFVGEILRALKLTGHDASAGDGRGVAITLPGWWTSGTTATAVYALHTALGPRVTVLSDAEAAVRAMETTGMVADDIVAVLDLGARTTSAGIVGGCRTSRPRQLGRSLVQIDGCGDDLDTGLLHHILHELGQHDPTTTPPSGDVAQALRRQCRQAKHRLSTDSATTFVLDHTEHATPIRVVRDELDELAMPWARAATRLLARAIESAGRDIGSVVVAGGGAHVPLVAQTISAELGLDVLLTDHPETLVARGASHSVAGVNHRSPSRQRRWPAFFTHARGRRVSVRAQTGPRRVRPSAPAMSAQSAEQSTAPTSRTTSRAS